MLTVPLNSLVSLVRTGHVVIITDRSILTCTVLPPKDGIDAGTIRKQEDPGPVEAQCYFSGTPEPRVLSYLLNSAGLNSASTLIAAGATWEDALGRKVKTVPLAGVHRVRRDFGDESITVTWGDTKARSRTLRLGPIKTTEDNPASTHNAVLDRIGVNGPGWREEAIRASRWRLAAGPIIGLVLTAALTAGGAWIAVSPPPPTTHYHLGIILEHLAHRLGVEGVIAIGAVIALVILACLGARLSKPPLETVYSKANASRLV